MLNKNQINLLLVTLVFYFISNNSFAQKLRENFMFEKVAENLNFPEGPAWDGINNLYVSSCYGGFIIKISDTDSSVFLKAAENPFTLKQTNGLTVGADSAIYACEFGIGAILKISPDGKTEIYAGGFQGKKFNRPNDLAFDPEGNLYFTDPHSYDKNNLDGVVYRIDRKTKEVKPVAEGIGFANGIAFSADAKNVFVCESALNRILKFDLNEEGLLVNKSVFVNLPGGDPDGIAFDVEGNLYAAHFGGGNIYVISPDGNIIKKIKTPGKKTSNLEFADDDMKTLYITEDEINSVYKTRMEIPGLKLFFSPAK